MILYGYWLAILLFIIFEALASVFIIFKMEQLIYNVDQDRESFEAVKMDKKNKSIVFVIYITY